MPIYQGCRVCRKGFELRRPADREPLERCPLCKAPVRKLVSQVHSPRVAKPFSTADAKSAGFTVLERRDRGIYEKL
jgi:putative FmdB family regulatory protein